VDDNDIICSKCDSVLKPEFRYCPFCGKFVRQNEHVKEINDSIVPYWLSWAIATIVFFVFFKQSDLQDIVSSARDVLQNFKWYSPFLWMLYSGAVLFGAFALSLLPAIATIFFKRWLVKGSSKRQAVVMILTALAFSAFLLFALGT
jgi:hypothetical protein